MTRVTLFVLMGIFASTPAFAQEVMDPPVLDLSPAWLEANINPRILDTLVDPDSAKVEWKYTTALIGSTEKIPNASGKKVKTNVRFAVTCGTVNSKNRMGGYAGKSFVIVAVWPTRLVVNYEDVGPGDGVRGMCEEYIRKGDIALR